MKVQKLFGSHRWSPREQQKLREGVRDFNRQFLVQRALENKEYSGKDPRDVGIHSRYIMHGSILSALCPKRALSSISQLLLKINAEICVHFDAFKIAYMYS